MRAIQPWNLIRAVRAPWRVLLAAALWGGLLAPCALAGTGIYWNFINNSPEDVVLHPQPSDPHECWDSSTFPDGTRVPAGSAILVYMERIGCVDSDFSVEVSGGEYDGAVARLWTDRQLSDHVAVRRNARSARSGKAIPTVPDIAIGTSDARMDTQIRFTGAGYYDTVAAWVMFAPGGAALPPGSWRQTCLGSLDAASGRLTADCMDGLRKTHLDTWLDYGSLCEHGSTVSNDQGSLRCDQLAPAVPRGSYLDTCRPYGFDATEGLLQAMCSDARGFEQPSSLELYYSCAPGSPLSNRQGQMVCDQAFMPAGSYRDQCPDPRYEDGVLRADCRTFVPLPGQVLDYQATCAPRSTVSLDTRINKLVCDRPKPPPAQ